MLLLIFLTSLAAALGSCPSPTSLNSSCSCSSEGGYQWYSCRAGGSVYRVKASVNRYAKVTCQKGPLPCPGLPLPVSNNSTLDHLHIQSCSRFRLACVVRSLRAHGARRVTVESAGGELAGDELEGLEIETLNLEYAHHQTSLPLDIFARHPSLQEVTITGAQLQLKPGPWPENQHLHSLTLRDDGIQDLPEGAFSSLKNLTYLSLQANEIKRTDGAFKGLANLQTLDLTSNPLEELSAASLAGAPRLQTLTLVYTALRVIRAGALKEVEGLEKLLIFMNTSPLTLEPLSSASLRSLNISESPLQPLPEGLLRTPRLEELVLASCGLQDLPEELFDGLENLVLLDLHQNRLQRLHTRQFWRLRRLRTLDLAWNSIRELPENMFAGLSDLETVHLDHNELVTLAPGAFDGAPLRQLTLSHNRLTLLQPGHEDVLASPLMSLTSLQRLDLSHNQLTRLFQDWRLSWVHHLREIDLSWNRIGNLTIHDLEFNPKVRVDLSHNEIHTIDYDRPVLLSDFRRRRKHIIDFEDYQELESTATIILDHNPFTCDCQLFPFLNHTRHKITNFTINQATCHDPPGLSNTSLTTVHLDCLICNFTQTCPEDCLCIERPAKSELEMQCLKPPESYIDPTIYDWSRTKLKVLKHFGSQIDVPEHVFSLNLTDLGVVEIPMFPNTVEELDLRLNNIEHVPYWVLERNLTLFLPNNSLKCDCDTLNFVMKLRDNSFKIHDYKDLVCKDGRCISVIDIESLCDVYYATIIGGTLATVGVLALIIAILVYHYSKELKIYIYVMGWDKYLHKIGLHIVYEEEIDEKLYDVMISYSDEKEKYIVEKFVPILEDEGYSVCVRYRDWGIGDWIPGKVAQLVEKSRRTIVFVSKEYLSSIASLELQAALMSEKRERRKRVLIVTTEDLEPDPYLKAFLDTRKSLSLEDETFWSRLRRKLPKRRRARTSRMTQKTLNVLMTAEGASYVLKRSS